MFISKSIVKLTGGDGCKTFMNIFILNQRHIRPSSPGLWLNLTDLRRSQLWENTLLLGFWLPLWVIINKSDTRNIIVQDLSQTPELIHFNSDIFPTPRSSFWGEMTLILILIAVGSKLTPNMLQTKLQWTLIVSAWIRRVIISQPPVYRTVYCIH